MIKKLLGLITVVIISCNNKNEYFIDNDFKNIIDKIILNDSMSNNLTIYLVDNEENNEIWIFGFGFLENCKDVKSIFEYNNRNIILIDNSKNTSFDSLVNFIKIKKYNNCETFIESLNDDILGDFKSFAYLYKENKLFYLNNHPIEYKNDTVILEKFIIKN